MLHEENYVQCFRQNLSIINLTAKIKIGKWWHFLNGYGMTTMDNIMNMYNGNFQKIKLLGTIYTPVFDY